MTSSILLVVFPFNDCHYLVLKDQNGMMRKNFTLFFFFELSLIFMIYRIINLQAKKTIITITFNLHELHNIIFLVGSILLKHFLSHS